MISTVARLQYKEHSPNGLTAILHFLVEEKFTFQEGQFVMLETDRIKDQLGYAMKRPYSIGTSNKQFQEQWIIGTIVKQSSDTGMSAFLVRDMLIGEKLVITWPLGHFTDPQHYRHYLFVSIGSGVTPIYGHYLHLSKESQRSVMIANIYGERSLDAVPPSLLQSFSVQSDSVRNVCFLSQEEHLPDGRHRGHVTDGLDEALAFLWTNDLVCFLCGKPAMVDDVKNSLINAWITKEQIVVEKY